MSTKRISVETGQQTSNDGDKDQKIVINSLDYDSLAKIIMLLLIPERIDMEEVCTKWKEACQLAWYDIKKYKCELSIGRCYDNRLLTQSYLEKILLRCGSYLKVLSLSDICNSSIMPFVSDHCKNLTSLECEFDVKSLIHNSDDFVQAFTHLDKLKCIKILVNHHRDYNDKTIKLAYCNIVLAGIDDDLSSPSVFKELSKLQYLEHLNLSSSENVKDSTIIAIANNCKNLKSLEIQRCTDITETGLDALTNLKNLEKLKVGFGHISDSFIIRLRGLKELDCCYCRELTDAEIPRCPIVLSSNDYLFNYSSVLDELSKLQCLERLNLCFAKGLKDSTITAIANNCKNLKCLEIQGCRGLTETALVALTNVKKLQKLNLTELENLEYLILDVLKLQKESIIAISNNCKKLKRLEIPRCSIVLSSNDYLFNYSSVLDELSKLQCLERLNLCFAKGLKDSTITAIANNCKNLKCLEIQGSRSLTETALVALTNMKKLQKLNSFEKFKNLQELTLHACRFLDSRILPEIAEKTTLVHLNFRIYDEDHGFPLFDKLVNLEYIDLTMNMLGYICLNANDFSTKVLETIFCTCKSLKHLDIPAGPYDVAEIPLKKWINFQNLQHLGIVCNMKPDLANTIVKYCKNLKYLRIHNRNISMNTALKKLTELENLECLMFSVVELHEEPIIAISNNCKKLKRLEILGCDIVPSIDGEPLSFPSVLDKLSKLQCLEHLNLCYAKNLEDSTIIAIANNCKNLKSLEIRGCTGLTEAALVGITNLKNLQKLDLHKESITVIANTCKKLKRLEMPCCYILPFINRDSRSILDEISKLQYLEHLRFSANLRDSTIIAIANNCKYLNSLEIQRCTGITKRGLNVLTKLKNLQKLNVSFLDIITDSFIIKLKGLKEFKCNSCKKLTDAGIIQFIKNNRDLQLLDATKYRTNDIILYIKIFNPSIRQSSKSIIKSQWLVVERT
ncbi:F-box/LRR-repeat protein 15-like [Aphidius gifuensis]|uniref:F-box/LRR-repeat protein 15-like n=1 Tax=Aphidius gifuensis TaxID=684658 RepID=UPI001CDD73FD|nr:F-box/LRR-repeat protein 15-like [Aphidius gifuensis]